MSCDYCIGDVQYGKASGDDAEVRCSLDQELPSLLQTDGSLHEFSFYFLYCTDYFNLRVLQDTRIQLAAKDNEKLWAVMVLKGTLVC